MELNLKYSLGPVWYQLLKPLFAQPYMNTLGQRLQNVQQLRPALNQVFDAFRLCQPHNIRVLVVGQDPFPSRHANGLAFSSTEPDLPLTLRIAFKALESQGFGARRNGDLTDWAKQGVFLLNSVLTCEEGRSLAHNDWGWQKFVGQALMLFSEKYKHPYVVMIWGKHAGMMIRNNLVWQGDNVQVLETCHPVAESYSEGRIKFKPHFKEANIWLNNHGIKGIAWNPSKETHDLLHRQACTGSVAGPHLCITQGDSGLDPGGLLPLD